VRLAAERPLVVALDGRSSSGKTTLAGRVAGAIPATAVVHTDAIAWWHSRFGWTNLALLSEFRAATVWRNNGGTMQLLLAVLTGLWRAPEFRKLWLGDTVSQLGSQVTLLALPLTAIVFLSAAPAQVAALTAVGFVAPAATGLLAGVWVDRLPRRPLLILTDLLRALVLGSVPLAAALGVLRIEQLYAVQLVAGGCTALADAAAQAHLPTLIGRDAVVEGNSKLASARSATRVVGPSLAGLLMQIVVAPTAILLDAASFVVSGICLLLIRQPEPSPRPRTQPNLWAEMHEGLSLVIRNRFLFPLIRATAAYNLFAGMFVAVSTVFMVRDLHLPAAWIGVIVATGGVGGVVGGVLAQPAAKRVGLGRAIIVGGLLLAVGHMAAPLAAGPTFVVVPLLASAGAMANFGLVVWLVNSTSLTQQLVPPHALGRVSATRQTIVLAAVPIGALIGGLLADAAGARLVVGMAAAGTIGSMLSLVVSPLPAVREVGATADSDETAPSGPPETVIRNGHSSPRSPLSSTFYQAAIPLR
jgi:MFS family permease